MIEQKKEYEELNKIIIREIPMTPHAENLGRGTFYTCPICAEKFCATDSEVVNFVIQTAKLLITAGIVGKD